MIDLAAQNQISLMISLDDSIKLGLSSNGTTVISDCGDAPSGGSAGDTPTVLRKLLDLGLDKSDKKIYLSLVDPRAAKAASNSGVGTVIELQLGHYFSKNDGNPLRINARVKTITETASRIINNEMILPKMYFSIYA